MKSDSILNFPSRNILRALLAAGVSVILLITGSQQVAAVESRFEVLDSIETVARRQQERLHATGLKWQSLQIYPEIKAQWQSTDNVYETRENEISDVILSLTPSLVIRRMDGGSVLSLQTFGKLNRLRDQKTENIEEFGARINSSFDIAENIRTRFGVALDSRHEERNSPDGATGLRPVPIKSIDLQSGAEWERGWVGISANARFRKLDYEDVPSLTGAVNHDDRDRTEFSGEMQLGFGSNRDLQAILFAALDVRNYDTEFDDAGISRESKGYRVAVGGHFNHLNNIYIEGFVGVIGRSYDDPVLNDVDQFWTRGRIVWNVSGLTSVQVSFDENIYETTLPGAAGLSSNRYGLQVDHELRRTLLMHLFAYRDENEYLQLNRRDRADIAGVGVEYQMNRHMIVEASWSWKDRDSNSSDSLGAAYKASLFSLGLRGRL